jgi:NADH dehydrogenase
MAQLKTQIVIVGGGAGGLELAKRLGRKYGRKYFDIILIERNSSHIWKPLLHEVAAGSLDANLDDVGYRSHGHRHGYRFFQGEMEGIDRETRKVLIAPIVDDAGREVMARHQIRYDYLIVAVGSVTNDFSIPGVADHCTFLDDRTQADRFRLRLLNLCLGLSRTLSLAPESDAVLRIAIVGGGATGVELAAELYGSATSLKHYGLEVFDETRLKVFLIEAGDRILPILPETVAEAARRQLESLGVQVLVGATIVGATDHGLTTRFGDFIDADLMVWAAGVKGPDILQKIAGLETNKANQIIVRPTLQSTRDDSIFAIGDCCFCSLGDGKNVPPRAQAAHQMAGTVYRNLNALIAGKPLVAFKYRDYGSLVSLSRFSTIGTLMGGLIGRLAIDGCLARWVYISLYRIHLINIHGFWTGMATILLSRINQFARPRLKMH